MERRTLWMLLLVLGVAGALFAGCGGDDHDAAEETDEGNAGSAGADRPDAGGAGTSSEEGVPCGTKHCTAPEGSTACCVDAFGSTCGLMQGAGCVVAPESDPRCPSVMGFLPMPSCCTDDNMCGIMSTFAGTGCIELAEAERMAIERRMMFMNMFADAGALFPDGGLPPGLPEGGIPMIDYPDPRPCD